MHRVARLFAFGVLAIVGCAHTKQITWRLETPQEMRQLLSDQLPAGTKIDAAQRFMEQEGFSCKIVRDGTFVEGDWFGAQQRYDNIDFLDCRRVQGAGHLLMSRTWGVALVLDGDVVQDVLVNRFLDGP